MTQIIQTYYNNIESCLHIRSDTFGCSVSCLIPGGNPEQDPIQDPKQDPNKILRVMAWQDSDQDPDLGPVGH